MRSALLALLVVLGLSGCQTTQSAVGTTTNTVVVSGGLFASIYVPVSAATANAIAATGIGVLMIADVADYRPPPELAPDRVIHEQDCTKPIERPTANLRCAPRKSVERPAENDAR